MGSEITAAAISSKIGQVRRDPFAMLPFIGYHVCDYFSIGSTWAENRSRQAAKDILCQLVPQDENNKFIWPGYGENSRVLKWIFERVSGKGKAVKTPIGYMPTIDALDLSGLDISRERMEESSAWIRNSGLPRLNQSKNTIVPMASVSPRS